MFEILACLLGKLPNRGLNCKKELITILVSQGGCKDPKGLCVKSILQAAKNDIKVSCYCSSILAISSKDKIKIALK